MPAPCRHAQRSHFMSTRLKRDFQLAVFVHHLNPLRNRERHMAHKPLVEPIEAATWGHASVMAEIHKAAFPATEAWSRDVMFLQLGMPAIFGLVYSRAGMILGRVAA